jgi:hypothetical protein
MAVSYTDRRSPISGDLPPIPPLVQLETPAVLKKAASSLAVFGITQREVFDVMEMIGDSLYIW